jgi:hypothetical protein
MIDDDDTMPPPPRDTIPNSGANTDPVKTPAHYVRLSPEPKDVIIPWRLPWALGNAVKYIARAGYKGDKIEDLRKAVTMIQFEIQWEERNR